MATLNTAFNIATGALNADQAALTVVSNNVANANTTGYTREVASWQENDPVTINGQSYGEGVTMTGPVSQRDLALEQALQQQGQVASASSARLTALQQVQTIFNQVTTANSGSSTSATNGIEQDMSQFFDSLSSLESSPADTALRQQVLTSATNLAGDFQTASSQLSTQQTSLDQQTGSLVTQVNSLTQSLAGLNQQIQSASPNSDAGTLEDQRQQDLQQLSQLVGIHQIQTENNGLEITTSNGALLVSGNQSFSLSTASVSGSLQVYDSQGNDITTSLTSGGGQIGGLLTVRDQDIPQMQSALDTMAFDLGSQINTQNQAGSDANGNPGVAIFNLPAGATGAAAQISVAITDPSQIAAAASGAGSSDDTNLLAMASLQNQGIVAGDTPSNYYSDFVTTVGSLVSGVSTQNAAQQASVSQLQNQIGSLSSVNLNEEASSLETFEQSYQSASKVFTILDEVMTAALNLGVETTYTG
ncbi:MAG: flagellar hook-associated protein FlgK [Silvibacterium sp.]